MNTILAALPRVLLGFVLLASGIAGLLHLAPAQTLEGPAALYVTGLTGTYLFTFVKLTEVATGALLLSNRFVPLALVIAAPVLLNIAAFHAFYAPSGLAVPVVMLASALFLAWKHRSAYGALLTANRLRVDRRARGNRYPLAADRSRHVRLGADDVGVLRERERLPRADALTHQGRAR